MLFNDIIVNEVSVMNEIDTIEHSHLGFFYISSNEKR
jgi:hypothetical protein